MDKNFFSTWLCLRPVYLRLNDRKQTLNPSNCSNFKQSLPSDWKRLLWFGQLFIWVKKSSKMNSIILVYGMMKKFSGFCLLCLILISDLYRVIMWHGCLPLFGQEWSCDLDTGLWLVQSDPASIAERNF